MLLRVHTTATAVGDRRRSNGRPASEFVLRAVLIATLSGVGLSSSAAAAAGHRSAVVAEFREPYDDRWRLHRGPPASATGMTIDEHVPVDGDGDGGGGELTDGGDLLLADASSWRGPAIVSSDLEMLG